MSEKRSFLLDVINILPEDIDCYFQAPSLDDESILSLMQTTQFDYYKVISLSGLNKTRFIQRIKEADIESYFHSVEIKLNNQLLFEGYDGVEYGTISNTVKLPQLFIDDYVNTGLCNVSEAW